MDRLIVSVSGVRGTVGGTLTPQVAMEFGTAFGTMLGGGGTVVLGRDTRPSGGMVKNAVAAGLMGCGLNVVDLGVVTTPGVALMTRLLEADGGVIVTASHNPQKYNGIKFLQSSGVALTAREADRLEGIRKGGRFEYSDGAGIGVETVDRTTGERHIEAVCATVDVTSVASKKFKVVLDSINGAGGVVTPMLLSRLGCEVVHINAEPTGRFGHEPEPIEANLGGLCEAVRQHQADVGFAQDPDADRLVLVDEKGNFLGEEYTLALTTAFTLRDRKGKVATNLSTSRMIDDIAVAAGVEVVRSPTGEANVVETMMREGCVFGGEGNGGVIDPRVVPVRNSLVGIAIILQYLAETGKSLSELAADIPAYHLVKIKMPCPPGAAERVISQAREAFADRPGAKLNDADGLRVDLRGAGGKGDSSGSWVSLRPSNTEPILRIFAEAPEASAAEALIREVRQIAETVIGD